MQHLAAADGVASHQRDHHLGQAADQTLQIKHIEARHARLIDITPIPAHALIAASAEGIAPILGRANTGEQHHTDAAVIANAGEGIAQFHHGAGSEGIAAEGSINRHAGNAIAAAIHKNVLVVTPGLPQRA